MEIYRHAVALLGVSSLDLGRSSWAAFFLSFFSKSGDHFCARKMRQEKLLFQQKWAPLLLAEQASLDNAQEKSFFLQSWCRLNATRCREKQSVFPLMGIVLRLIFSVWQLESPWKPWHLKKPCYLKT
ncbi:MAG: hypothetical protein ACTSY1_02815 [Alphaproteobacteria bacterium]